MFWDTGQSSYCRVWTRLQTPEHLTVYKCVVEAAREFSLHNGNASLSVPALRRPFMSGEVGSKAWVSLRVH